MKHAYVLILTLALCKSVAMASYLNLSEIYEVVPQSKVTYGGLREFKPVLHGVLYRGGGSGGKKPLNQTQLQALCADGFTDAGYLYPDNFAGPSVTDCGSNQISYNMFGYLGAKGALRTLQHIHQLIQNGGKMFVHCWNGWHASGEVAAYALVQFCDYSAAEAAAYWKRNVGDGANISRIGKFVKQAGMEITAEEKERICPR